MIGGYASKQKSCTGYTNFIMYTRYLPPLSAYLSAIFTIPATEWASVRTCIQLPCTVMLYQAVDAQPRSRWTQAIQNKTNTLWTTLFALHAGRAQTVLMLAEHQAPTPPVQGYFRGKNGLITRPSKQVFAAGCG